MRQLACHSMAVCYRTNPILLLDRNAARFYNIALQFCTSVTHFETLLSDIIESGTVTASCIHITKTLRSNL